MKSHEDTQETLALLKLLALGRQDIDAGRTRAVTEVIDRLRSATWIPCCSDDCWKTLGEGAIATVNSAGA